MRPGKNLQNKSKKQTKRGRCNALSSFDLQRFMSKTISRVMSLNGHLSRPDVTTWFKRPTRKQTGRLMLSVRSCFEWGLHVPRLLPAGR